MSAPIESYGFIGNMVSAALVGRDGSVDWLCLPHFDSDACFAALLGTPEHGRWLIAPQGEIRQIQRRYLPGTAILETTFETAEGAVAMTDFMPLTEDEDYVDVVRLVQGVRGRVPMRMELIVRFGYGNVVPWVRRQDFGMRAIAGCARRLSCTARISRRSVNSASARARPCRSRSPITARIDRAPRNVTVTRASKKRSNSGAARP